MPVHTLKREEKKITAGTVQKIFKNPMGRSVRLKTVSIFSDLANKFVRIRAVLYFVEKNSMIIVGDEWQPDITDGGGFRMLDQNWGSSYDLYVTMRTQIDGTTLYYTIEYEPYPAEEKARRRWW